MPPTGKHFKHLYNSTLGALIPAVSLSQFARSVHRLFYPHLLLLIKEVKNQWVVIDSPSLLMVYFINFDIGENPPL
jgi:hypothetical protein